MTHLTTRQQEGIVIDFKDGISMHWLADSYGVTVAQIQFIIRQALTHIGGRP